MFEVIYTAAAPAGIRQFKVLASIGGVTYYVAMCWLPATSNTIGQLDRINIGQGAQLLAGDIVYINTFDSSTGGAIDYYGSVLVTEYDA